jgi:hypothetical protein
MNRTLISRIEEAADDIPTATVTNMDSEKEVERIAEQYRDEGYVVVTHPDVDHLPEFAADFGVDLVATRGDGRVLVQVKQNRAAVEADPMIPVRAGITATQPGWRYDLVGLHEDDPNRRALKEAREPTREQIEQMLAEAEKVTKDGALRSGFVVGWAGLEAAMRRAAQKGGVGGVIGTPPTTLLREVYASGYIPRDDCARVDEARRLRTEIVHGLASPGISSEAVYYLVRLARHFLALGDTVQAAS